MDVKVKNGFVIYPTVEVTPVIRISPFTENCLGSFDADISVASSYLRERFGQNYCVTIKAREAIKLALSYYKREQMLLRFSLLPATFM